MNNPKTYLKVNFMQRRDAAEALDLAKNYLTWSCDETVLDVGCGPGDVTTSLLSSYLPSSAKVVGSDISEAMIRFAQATYENDRHSFKQMDIASENIWMNWKEESFNKIFSLHCLHWVENQMQAAKNMYNLLKPSGYITTLFLTHHGLFSHFDDLQRKLEWKSYPVVWKTWDAISAKEKDPKEEYQKILTEVGFEVLFCQNVQRTFTHDSKKSFIDFYQQVNPFQDVILEDKIEEFIESSIPYLIDNGELYVTENKEFVLKYRVMTTVAQKVPVLI